MLKIVLRKNQTLQQVSANSIVRFSSHGSTKPQEHGQFGFYRQVELFYDRAAKILEDKLVNDMTKSKLTEDMKRKKSSRNIKNY